jgi:hypothetical protein
MKHQLTFQQTIRRYRPENSTFHNHRCRDLKSCLTMFYFQRKIVTRTSCVFVVAGTWLSSRCVATAVSYGCLEIWKVVMLVLLMWGIYKVRLWDGLRCHSYQFVQAFRSLWRGDAHTHSGSRLKKGGGEPKWTQKWSECLGHGLLHFRFPAVNTQQKVPCQQHNDTRITRLSVPRTNIWIPPYALGWCYYYRKIFWPRIWGLHPTRGQVAVVSIAVGIWHGATEQR